MVQPASAPASQPASRPAGRDVPVYTRADMVAVLKAVEHDKGEIAAARDKALTRADLSEAFARSLQAQLDDARAAAASANVVRWVIAAASLAAGVAIGAVAGALFESSKRASPASNTNLAPLEAWQRPANGR
jgi:hypothetical protein